jgi:protein O-mannosyl-transferase
MARSRKSPVPGRSRPVASRSSNLAFPLAILAVATVAAYARVGSCGFVNFDDPLYVTENPHVLAGLTLDGIRWAFTTFATGNWHPLTWLSHMADVSLFGVSPGAHHVVSLVLHVLSTSLLFVMLARATGASWRSFAAAALFGLHPLHVESVAWIAERKDVLSGLLSLATIALFVRGVRRGGALSLGPALGCFALALLAKPMAVSLPFALLLVDAWPLGRVGRVPFARLVLEKAPFLALAAGSAAVTVVAQRSVGAVHSLGSLPLAPRLANALVSYVAYLGKLAWPAGLAVFYPFRLAIPAWQWLAALALLAAVTALALAWRGARPWLAAGWLWYLGTLLPVSGVVQAGSQAMADRYAYLPSIGLGVMVAWGAAELIGRLRAPVAAGAGLGAAAGLALGAVTFTQVGAWTDSLALYRHALAVTRHNAFVEKNLGATLQQLGRLEEAAPYLDAAVRDDPRWADAWYNRGLVREGLGRYADAAGDYAAAARLDPGRAAAHLRLGAALFHQGRAAEAVPELERAVALAPGDADARDALGAALATLGRYAEAEVQLAEALRLRPGFADARANLERLRSLDGAATPQGRK